MIIGIFVTVAVILVAFGGLLAAADAALSVLSRTDLIELATVSRSKQALLGISKDVGAHVNAINFMRVVSETTAAVLVTLSLAYSIDDWWWALLIAAGIMIVVSFVLVGTSPRSVGRVNARPIIAFAAPLIRVVRIILGPIASALVALGNRVTPGRPPTVTFSSEEQLLSMVDEATELEVLEEDDRELIHSIFEFNDTVVREVMVPRTDMLTIDGDESMDAAMKSFLATGHSRMPVLGDDIDDVIGVLYLRDVARLAYERGLGTQALEGAAVTAAEIARAAMFVPESQKADDLLRQMQLESNHLAMVVDEYGGIAGLVTMEDVIEELVGDISDEYDREAAEYQQLENGVYRVSARMPIDELGDLFGLELEDDEVDSVGGLITKVLGRLPVVGARAEYSGLVLTAERTEGRRKRLSTVLVEPDQALIDAQSAFSDGRGTDGRAQSTEDQ